MWWSNSLLCISECKKITNVGTVAKLSTKKVNKKGTIFITKVVHSNFS